MVDIVIKSLDLECIKSNAKTYKIFVASTNETKMSAVYDAFYKFRPNEFGSLGNSADIRVYGADVSSDVSE